MSLISAGCVVKTNIPPKSMVVGNPSKIVGVCEKPLAYGKGISYNEFINNLKPIRKQKKKISHS
jgi:serine acetyltransferase